HPRVSSFTLSSRARLDVTATPAIYTLSLHDALPIWCPRRRSRTRSSPTCERRCRGRILSAGAVVERHAYAASQHLGHGCAGGPRSEEHTSELQSRENLVCRLLLEKQNQDYGRLVARQ